MQTERSIPILPVAAPARQCGECRACCEGWAAGTIRGHAMYPGKPCHFLADEGCSIYETRPISPCRNFVCGWLAPGSPFPEPFRPDRLGVIVITIQWRERPAYLLLSAGRDPDDALIEWMSDHARRTSTPFFFSRGGERLGFGPPEFQRDMLARLERKEPLW